MTSLSHKKTYTIVSPPNKTFKVKLGRDLRQNEKVLKNQRNGHGQYFHLVGVLLKLSCHYHMLPTSLTTDRVPTEIILNKVKVVTSLLGFACRTHLCLHDANRGRWYDKEFAVRDRLFAETTDAPFRKLLLGPAKFDVAFIQRKGLERLTKYVERVLLQLDSHSI